MLMYRNAIHSALALGCYYHTLDLDNSPRKRITSRWTLMAARGWARLIYNRRRGLINDRPNRATAAEAPMDGAQECCHFDNPTTHTHGAYQHGEAA